MSDLRQDGKVRNRVDRATRYFVPRGWRHAYAIGALRLWLGATIEREMEAGRGFLWLPVLFGAGIVIYFALPAEPSGIALFLAAALLVIAAGRSRERVVLFRTLAAFAAVVAGVAVMKARTDIAAAPVLGREMTTTVTGWVSAREAASRGGVRVLLRVDHIDKLRPERTPETVRVTIRSKADGIAVGDAIAVLARLRPPTGPTLPGGYDFARADYYQGVGAAGFAYGAARPAEIGPPPLGIRLATPVAHIRQGIRERIIAALPGDNGQIAAALVMGDRRGISESTQEAMRASGLGHILAISGLHMVLVAGSAFWLIRALLALSPALAINRPIRKWAAAGALAVGAVYLAISGSGVSTQRAFIMLAVMLVAVMIDRRAITLRNVAVAALIVLFLEPESVLTASFQMSFAATLALVAGYEAIREHAERGLRLAEVSERGVLARLMLSARSLFLTSLIAGLATTPFAIYHFQRAAPLTLIANLLAMPVVGLVVMPMAFFAVLLMPFGLEAVPLAAMGWGLDWIVFVARTTAAWSEDWGGIPMAPAAALLCVVAGFLWLALWHERWRLLGLVPLAVAIPIFVLAPRPDILVDQNGTTAAVRGADGRYRIVGLKANRFAVETWLRADADQRPISDALSEGVTCDAIGCVTGLANGMTVAVSLKPAAFADDCHLAQVVVSRFAAPDRCRETATVIDRGALKEGGAQALYLQPDQDRRAGIPHRDRISRDPAGLHAAGRSVAPQQTDELALDPHPVGSEDSRFVRRIGRLQGDRSAFAPQSLQRRLFFVDESDNDVAGFRGIRSADQDRIAVENACLDHRVAPDVEGEMLARRQHVRRDADRVTVGLDRLDRRAGGDAAHDRNHHRFRQPVVADRLDATEAPLDHTRRETTGALDRRRRRFRHPHDFDGARPVRQAADETALLQRPDQAVNSGLRPQVERVLHLVEGRRNPGFLQTLMNEHQEFVLLPREHGRVRNVVCTVNQVQSTNKLPCSICVPQD